MPSKSYKEKKPKLIKMKPKKNNKKIKHKSNKVVPKQYAEHVNQQHPL